jgi:hypothetical protein
MSMILISRERCKNPLSCAFFFFFWRFYGDFHTCLQEIVQSAKIISNKAKVISLNLLSHFLRTCKKKKKKKISLYLIILLYTLVFFPIFSHNRGIDSIHNRINNDDFQFWKVTSM